MPGDVPQGPEDFQSPDDFEDAFTPLQANSSGLHEVFVSHCNAGFSGEQALFLLAAQLGANIVVP